MANFCLCLALDCVLPCNHVVNTLTYAHHLLHPAHTVISARVSALLAAYAVVSSATVHALLLFLGQNTLTFEAVLAEDFNHLGQLEVTNFLSLIR